MSTPPIALDFSKAQKLDEPTLDFSKAQKIDTFGEQLNQGLSQATAIGGAPSPGLLGQISGTEVPGTGVSIGEATKRAGDFLKMAGTEAGLLASGPGAGSVLGASVPVKAMGPLGLLDQAGNDIMLEVRMADTTRWKAITDAISEAQKSHPYVDALIKGGLTYIGAKHFGILKTLGKALAGE